MAEPITVAEAAEHLRLDTGTSPIPEFDKIERTIIAARKAAENFLNRTIVVRTRTEILDAFTTVINLPNGDVSSIDSISYIDSNGDAATVGNWILSEDRLTAAYGESWPATRDQLGAVTITYTAGYAPTGSPAEDTTPEDIVEAMLEIIAGMYDNRDSVSQSSAPYQINSTTENLLFPYRIDLGV